MSARGLEQRAAELFAADLEAVHRRTDRFFAGLMIGQWVFVVQGSIFVFCVLLFRRGFVGELAHHLRVRL